MQYYSAFAFSCSFVYFYTYSRKVIFLIEFLIFESRSVSPGSVTSRHLLDDSLIDDYENELHCTLSCMVFLYLF